MDFYTRVAQYLNSEFAAQTATYDDTSLNLLIKQHTALARLYKFTHEMETVQFIDLLWRIGFDFDTDPAYPWARTILANKRLPSSDKIALLRNAYAIDRAQKTAEAM